MAHRFDVLAGLSDHTLGVSIAIAAVALGASVIEKHVTLSRSDGGVDSTFSLEPEELRQLVQEAGAVARAVRGPQFGPKPSEKKSLEYRRSLYAIADVEAGEVFTTENVKAIRPGFGLPPKHLRDILGHRSSRSVSRGTPLSLDMVDGT